MRTVLVFTIVYTVTLLVYGLSVGSPLTLLYTGINIGLFILFGILHIWARWPVHALWAVSLVGLGNMLGGVLLVDGQPLYMAEVLGPLLYDKVFHAVASGVGTLRATGVWLRVGDELAERRRAAGHAPNPVGSA